MMSIVLLSMSKISQEGGTQGRRQLFYNAYSIILRPL
jgi:hypothetical protein